MTYIDEFEKELRKKLEAEEPADAIISWCREKILESYRNGASTPRTRRRFPEDSKEEKNEPDQGEKTAQQGE